MTETPEQDDPGIEWGEPRDDPDEEPSHPGAEGDEEEESRKP
jgi:hypothetical protein